MPDELWRAAMETARRRGETLSQLIREWLVEYIEIDQEEKRSKGYGGAE